MCSRGMARSRFDGGVDELHNLLKPFATIKSWLRYGETAKVSEARVIPEQIVAHYPLLEALHEACPNLCFVRSEVLKVMGRIFDENCETWAMDQSYKASYIDSMSKRFMNLCHIVGQASKKGSKPEWYLGLSWVEDGGAEEIDSDKKTQAKTIKRRRTKMSREEPKASKPDGDDDDRDDEEHYYFGFSEEMGEAWRKKAGDRHAVPETTCTFEVPADVAGIDSVIAVWADGCRHAMTELIVEKYRTMEERASKRRSMNEKCIYWEGERMTTHAPLSVRRRADRAVLISIFEKKRQLLQVRADRFLTEEAAAQFMVELAKKYASGEVVDKFRLHQLRDATMPKKATMKRPASSSIGKGSGAAKKFKEAADELKGEEEEDDGEDNDLDFDKGDNDASGSETQKECDGVQACDGDCENLGDGATPAPSPTWSWPDPVRMFVGAAARNGKL